MISKFAKIFTNVLPSKKLVSAAGTNWEHRAALNDQGILSTFSAKIEQKALDHEELRT